MKKQKPLLQVQRKGIDMSLLICILILMVFGVIMVYDSSVIQGLNDFKDSYYYIRQQLVWAALGFASMFLFSRFDYRRFKVYALSAMLASFLLLLAVFIPGFGISGGGAHRWLRIGQITVQPAEIIKLTGVIYLASIFEKKHRVLPFMISVISVALVTAVLQKDLGSTIVFVAIATLMYIASGAPIWHLLPAIPLGIAGLLTLIFTSGYRSKRVLAFLDPFSDPQGYSYHISQVLIALGSGGLF